MEKTIHKRIHNLLVRIGDEGTQFYSKQLEKLVSITPTFMKQEDQKQCLLDSFQSFIKLNPGKSYIYACYFTIQLNAYPEEFEKLMDRVFLDLQLSVTSRNLFEADNLMQFFAEVIKLGVLNIFLFIQILIDMVSASEHNKNDFLFFMTLVLNSISTLENYEQKQKYEMELSNLAEDIERIFNKQNYQQDSRFQLLHRYFLALKNKGAPLVQIFSFENQECLQQIKKVNVLRKNFKLEISKNENYDLLAPERIRVFEQKVFELNAGLNEHVIYFYLWKTFICYNKNTNLWLAKLTNSDFKEFAPLRDFLLMELLFTYIYRADLLENSLISSLVLSKLINCYNYTLFFEDCWRTFKSRFYLDLNELSLQEINSFVKSVVFLNFSTHKTYSFGFADIENVLSQTQRNEISDPLQHYILTLFNLQEIFYNQNREDVARVPLKIDDQLIRDHEFLFENILQFVKSNSDPDIFDQFAKEVLFINSNYPLLPDLFGRAFLTESSQSFTHFKSYIAAY